jgi:hypothetical protein
MKTVLGANYEFTKETSFLCDIHVMFENELAKSGLKLKWESRAGARTVAAKKESKVKFTCPNCEQNSWGKPDTKLICGICYQEDGRTYEMEAA